MYRLVPLFTLFILTLFPASSSASGDSIPGLEKPVNSLNFLVLGDWGRNGAPAQTRVAQQMGEAGAYLLLSFVIATGDNFYESGIAGIHDPQWQTSFENVYTATSLQVPWFPVLGNHDYGLNPDAQVQYSSTSKRWTMPARYYDTSFAVGNDSLLLVFLDTDPIEREFLGRQHDSVKFRAGDVTAQLDWLEKTLSSSHARWKIVTGHNPLHTGGSRRHSSRTKKMRAILQPLFYKYSVNVYLSGHEHHLEYLKPSAGPTHYIISGAGSEARHVGKAKRYRRFAARKKGFAAMSVSPEQILLQFISDKGKLLYSHTIIR